MQGGTHGSVTASRRDAGPAPRPQPCRCAPVLCLRTRALPQKADAQPSERWSAQEGLTVELPAGLTDQQLLAALRPYQRFKIWRCAAGGAALCGGPGSGNWQAIIEWLRLPPPALRRFADPGATFSKVRQPPRG